MRLIVALVLLGACTPADTDTGTETPYVAPLAPPWVAITASTFDGAFRSDCTMGAVVTDADGNEVSTLTLAPADGGLWTGVALDPDQQRKLTMTWADCVNNDNGTGEFTSSTFSGTDGDLFVAHYNGSTKNFEWMQQGIDHLGGEVHATFYKNSSTSELDDLAASLDVESRDDGTDDKGGIRRYFSWTDTRNVVEVLDGLRASELYLWGEPTWVAQPSWW